MSSAELQEFSQKEGEEGEKDEMGRGWEHEAHKEENLKYYWREQIYLRPCVDTARVSGSELLVLVYYHSTVQ
jgi:hypothetical protein